MKVSAPYPKLEAGAGLPSRGVPAREKDGLKGHILPRGMVTLFSSIVQYYSNEPSG